jgi:steroid 5-alpha reductase family enzyme
LGFIMTGLEVLTAVFAIGMAMSVIMTLAWIAQQSTGNSGWVDTTWSFGVGLCGVVAALVTSSDEDLHSRQILVACFAGLWAARLGFHIASRSLRVANDPRYAEMVKEWGADARRRMFLFLQIQASVSIPLILAMFLAAHRPGVGLTLADGLAIAVMVIAVAGEAISDWQLRRFKADPAGNGGIMDTGMWRWSRHPNYFFEVVGWLAYPLVAIDWSGGYLWGWLTLTAPVCMYWLLVYVSGIPPLEQHMLRSRGDAFRAYQRRTNAFFLGPPRS